MSLKTLSVPTKTTLTYDVDRCNFDSKYQTIRSKSKSSSVDGKNIY